MSQSLSSAASYASGSTAQAILSKVVYRSRAVQPLSAPELHQLAVDSQSRNRNEAVTGLVLYDDSRFFQWLEGPTDSLERIMQSIRCDPRHTDIEVLHNQPTQSRCFGDWNMKLAAQHNNNPTWQQDVIEPPQEIILNLRQHPDAAPALLVKLVPAAPGATQAADQAPRLALNRQTATILKDVIVASVFPEFVERQARTALWPAHPRSRELADLLIETDATAAVELIKELRAAEELIQPLYAALFEPVARTLGDLWGEDGCTEFDVTLGLCRMQSAIRMLRADAPAQAISGAIVPAVLIAPEPGELHQFGASLDSDVLWDAGWAPHCAYPTTDKALQDLVAGRWFDVLDLSLSAAFRREHWLPRVTTTIAQARKASRNPALVVIVGGRVFAEEQIAGLRVGADVSSTTALQVQKMIVQGLAAPASRAPAMSSRVPASHGADNAPASRAARRPRRPSKTRLDLQ